MKFCVTHAFGRMNSVNRRHRCDLIETHWTETRTVGMKIDCFRIRLLLISSEIVCVFAFAFFVAGLFEFLEARARCVL